MYFDLPLDQLKTYVPPRSEPAAFDSFWQNTLAQARRFPLNPVFERVDVGLARIETYDVTFSGFAGQPIKAWLNLPADRKRSLPCLVEYIGYGGGRGFATDWLLWSSVGYAHFIMDTRGQGSAWRSGDTPDFETEPGNPHFPGFMSRGVLHPETYYYRRVFADAVRAIETARAHPDVDGSHIGVTGVSQGGGISLAAAALADNVEIVMPDVPFLCNFSRAITITDTSPYLELAKYLETHRDRVDQVMETLAYFDGMNFAPRARGSALFSTALMDEICPPSTVFSAYNHYAGPKQIKVWQFNHHEGGEGYQTREKIKFVTAHWAR
ncbi:MAG: acetylxylan esterase [Anaerolineae bacterium]|nr:acetylxylan esterase [Anaerolineae bacterium]